MEIQWPLQTSSKSKKERNQWKQIQIGIIKSNLSSWFIIPDEFNLKKRIHEEKGYGWRSILKKIVNDRLKCPSS